jgi:hypothetical protein
MTDQDRKRAAGPSIDDAESPMGEAGSTAGVCGAVVNNGNVDQDGVPVIWRCEKAHSVRSGHFFVRVPSESGV